VLIPVTASNIPELLLADPRFEQATRNVVFWHKKISQILWLFSIIANQLFFRLYPLYPMASVPWKIHHTGNLSEGTFSHHISYTINPEAIPRSLMD
jgi:hypothetical protein